ncbi:MULTISPECIES: excalibur calcium-binding domain-containing protein [Psychrobacter]|uniref:excalibur calcium-binding domain-containing protein n=1 Tax=Psychrobacter TaxID=497 RepID=UPI0004123543|nr:MULTISPECIES: excalibur calcium-binding domain-containing protein [Psychrobacter]
MKKTLMVVVLLVLALVGYKILNPKNNNVNNVSDTVSTTANSERIPVNFDDFDDIPPSYVDDNPNSASIMPTNAPITTPAPVTTTLPTFSCDGRKHCSQMTSCSEATYFIQHCPNTKMDGNNDGVPCEKQWCK